MECLTVIGEVENLGAKSAEFVMVIVTAYDKAGEVIAVDFTFSMLDVVSAHGTSPFKAYICDHAAEIVRYSCVVQHD